MTFIDLLPVIITIFLALLAGKYLISCYFEEKENFVERLNNKLKGTGNAKE